MSAATLEPAATLRARGISKGYPGVQALQDVALEIAPARSTP
jgi:ABC-type sugar transport system ATPase subunit